MAETVISDAIPGIQDEGLPNISDNSEDWGSAGLRMMLAQAVDSDSYVRSDTELTFTGHDGTNDTVDVTAGVAYLDLTGETVDVQSSFGGSSPPAYDLTLPSLPAIPVIVPTTVTGVAVQDSTLSSIWLAFDTDGTGPGSAGSVYVRSDDTGSVTAPSHPSVELGQANPDNASADSLLNRFGSPTFDAVTSESVDTKSLDINTELVRLPTLTDSSRLLATRGDSGPLSNAAAQMEDLSNWSGDITAETGTVYRGSQSAAIPAGGQIDYTFPATDLSDIHPSISIYTPSGADEDFEITYRDGDGNRVRYYDTLTASDEWLRYDLGAIHEFQDTGVPDTSAITGVWFTGFGSSSDTIYVDDLRFTEVPANDGYVMFTFDDGDNSIFDNAYPILDKHGLAGGAFIIRDNVGESGYMTESELQTLSDAGWDVLNHQKSNTSLIGMTESEIRDEIGEGKRFLLENGHKEAGDALAYQGGGYNGEIADIASDYAHLAFRTGGHLNGGIPPLVTSPHNLNRYFASGESVSDITEAIDLAQRYGTVLQISFHDVSSGGEISPTDFESVVDHTVSNGLEVITPSQFWRKQLANL